MKKKILNLIRRIERRKEGYWGLEGKKGKLFRFFAYRGIYQTNWAIKKHYGNLFMHDRTMWRFIKKSLGLAPSK